MTLRLGRSRSSYDLARVAALAMAFGILVTVQAVYFQRGVIPGDAFTYLAAGERLNDGHALYALSPGDRPVDLHPPFWTVPLLSPPPIAVLLRPFALLPGDLGAYAWWAVCLAALGLSIVALIGRKPITTAIAVGILSIPIAYEIGVGNLNALVLAGLVAAWYCFARRLDGATGVVLAAATALKITPGIMFWWLLTQRRWSSLRAFVAAGVVIAIISVIGAGLSAHLEYLGIVRDTSASGSSDLSSAGIARLLGVPAATASLLPAILLIIGFVGIWLLRARPGVAYAVAIVTMLAASPVLNVNWFTLLLAAIAPLAWPAPPTDRGSRGPDLLSNDQVASD